MGVLQALFFGLSPHNFCTSCISLFSHTQEALSCDTAEVHLQLKLQKWPIMFSEVVKRLQFVTAVWSPKHLKMAEL